MDGATTALLITSIGALVKLFWSDYQADRRAVREREWAMEDRQQVAAKLATSVNAKAAENTAQLEQLHVAIKENTELTNDVGDKAEAAYKEANSINLKIENIGIKLLDRATP